MDGGENGRLLGLLWKLGKPLRLAPPFRGPVGHWSPSIHAKDHPGQVQAAQNSGIMSLLKFSLFLALGIFVLHQVDKLQAAPFQSSVENNLPPASLSEEEGDFLLALLVREFMKKMANEKEHLAEGSSITAQKRACNTGTCLTQKLAGLLSRSGSVANTKMLPPDMVANNSGRKGRDLDA
ncbi:calcitonin gene-related peptide 1-like [Sturnira hondurensis]|uniref:calcitonin gene-related peptide 1-like n=1 Tax=Sturnira hondurensis TaxID=192404 RepID=UPI001879C773|nr:calcitonin gene-related peptide 1-like [Sturnira hondurensis]